MTKRKSLYGICNIYPNLSKPGHVQPAIFIKGLHITTRMAYSLQSKCRRTPYPVPRQQEVLRVVVVNTDRFAMTSGYDSSTYGNRDARVPSAIINRYVFPYAAPECSGLFLFLTGRILKRIVKERWQTKGIMPMVCVLAAWRTCVRPMPLNPKLTRSDERDPVGSWVVYVVILNRLGPFNFGCYSTGGQSSLEGYCPYMGGHVGCAGQGVYITAYSVTTECRPSCVAPPTTMLSHNFPVPSGSTVDGCCQTVGNQTDVTLCTENEN